MPLSPLSPLCRNHCRNIGLQLNDVMNFVAPFARGCKAGNDYPDHAVLDWNRITDFEFRFVGAPSEGLACRFVHLSIVAHHKLIFAEVVARSFPVLEETAFPHLPTVTRPMRTTPCAVAPWSFPVTDPA